MLTESIIAIAILAIVFSLFFSVAIYSRNICYKHFYELKAKSQYNQLKMLIERDFFIRRRSQIECAHKDAKKFCMGFWEESDEELKYIVYDIHIKPDSENGEVVFFRRYCMNQDTLNGEYETYCEAIIHHIAMGTYIVPNRVYYNDFTELFKGTVYTDGEVLNFNYGDYQYTFPL